MEKAKAWLNETKISLFALIGNIIFIIYMGAIQMNDVKNMVMKHEQMIIKLETKMIEIDNQKVDKETFNIVISNISEIKNDMKDLKNAMIEHLNRK